VVLPETFTAEVIACWLSEFWLGMEFADLLGVKEEQVAHQHALDAVQSLLERLDAHAQATRAPPAAARRAKASAHAPKRRATTAARKATSTGRRR
jgi:hypothetical protein